MSPEVAPASRPGARAWLDSPLHVAGLYLAATLILTWPLVLHLDDGVAWDMIDPLLNSWIVAWGADHVVRFAAGDVGAFSGYWAANIFHPHPLALAFSEHLFALSVQAAPVWALTGNAVLCYNLLLLSTYVLSGVGMWLLVRDITGSGRAGFVAGLVYAFLPYRVAQLPHLQVLSSQWMPFALFALRRCLDGPTPLRAAGVTLALLAQNLSNGYYLLFFTPMFALWTAWELSVRRRWLHLPTVAGLAAAGAVTIGVTALFLQPYLAIRQLGFRARSIGEVAGYAADVFSYVTTSPGVHLWGAVARAVPQPEGELFPGAIPVLLAAIGVWAVWGAAAREPAATAGRSGRLQQVAGAGVAVAAALLAAHLLIGRPRVAAGPLALIGPGFAETLAALAVAGAAWLALSTRARQTAGRFLKQPAGVALVLLLVSVTLSMGPEVRSLGRRVAGWAPYALLYEWVPGFDGLRVPARYGMVAMLWLALLAGVGIGALERRGRSAGYLALALGLLYLVEGAAMPLPMNPAPAVEGFKRPAGRLQLGDREPQVYAFLRTLPDTAVIAELPFGIPAFDARYMAYSTLHWRRLVNGYSGGFPPHYADLRAALRRVEEGRPSNAWERLRRAGTTHVVVHDALYRFEEGEAVHAWLSNHGARRLPAFRTDVVYELPR